MYGDRAGGGRVTGHPGVPSRVWRDGSICLRSRSRVACHYQYGCETAWLPPFPPAVDAQPIQGGASTCTIFQSGSTLDDTHLVPASGTILSARVKSGAHPAPLQITTMRRYFKPDAQGQMEYTCCAGISQTATFQPTPNAVTEVPVNLRVSTQQPENARRGGGTSSRSARRDRERCRSPTTVPVRRLRAPA